MDIKKTKNADLESKKLTSFLIGYILVFAVIFVAFEWTEKKVDMKTYSQGTADNVDEEIIPFTVQNLPPPPPPPTIAQDILNIVETDVDIEEVEIKETEATEETKVDTRVFDPNATYGEAGGEEVDEEIPFASMENPPTFPGGDAKLLEWVQKNVQYPKGAKNRGEKGRVTVSFVIDKTGKVMGGKVERGVSSELDAEALRVVSIMPNWTPGKQNGKLVKVRYMLPITFRLTN
ncbi:MAG: energy transducer TonB [Bacteroidales bacterium]|nr:energy transducer TonB [Bacteroidales bacterium]MDD4823474.1 energy transducer TonB [Bacteroidales bacterium]